MYDGTCDVWRVMEFGRSVGKGPVEACQVLGIVHSPDNVPNVIYVISVVPRHDACNISRNWFKSNRPGRPHKGLGCRN
jgi:hypothetical protein